MSEVARISEAVARGSLTVNGQTLNEGDGASTSTAGRLAFGLTALRASQRY